MGNTKGDQRKGLREFGSQDILVVFQVSTPDQLAAQQGYGEGQSVGSKTKHDTDVLRPVKQFGYHWQRKSSCVKALPASVDEQTSILKKRVSPRADALRLAIVPREILRRCYVFDLFCKPGSYDRDWYEFQALHFCIQYAMNTPHRFQQPCLRHKDIKIHKNPQTSPMNSQCVHRVLGSLGGPETNSAAVLCPS